MNVKKIILAPDSFKGSLTAKEVTDIIASEISVVFPDCEIVKMPIADGGEGSVDTILSSLGGRIYEESVLSPDEREISAFYGITGNGTAIIEMAQSSGITKQNGLHPMTSTTFGFGQLLLAALGTQGDGSLDKTSVSSASPPEFPQFCQKNRPPYNENRPPDNRVSGFILCIGGSATTDGGCGMAAALGVRFTDKHGNSFVPSGETLIDITGIDISGMDSRIAESSFTVMCDVDNPLFGPNGAAHVYAPQKGATSGQIRFLDDGLRHYGVILNGLFGRSFSELPGAGAAGGLGAGCVAFLGAELKSGIEAILGLCDFKMHAAGADLIITGEGKLDSQSFQGKVLSGLLKEAENVPVWSICGVCDCDENILRENRLTVFEASEGITTEECMKEPEKYLRTAVQRLCRKLNGSASNNTGNVK